MLIATVTFICAAKFTMKLAFELFPANA